jgi:diguanylate cyclase (GGDEF)-like protein/PAS domain S-box-containing protein
MPGPAFSGRTPSRAVLRKVAWSWQTWLWLGVALAVIGLHAAQPADSPIGEWTYLAVGTGASIAAWIGASRAAADRVVGRLVALGVTLSATGDLVSQLLAWFSATSADVTVADLPWLGSYIALSAAMLRMLRLSRDLRGAFVDGLVDVAVIGVLVLLVEWEVSIGALVRDDSLPSFTRLVWTLYPACDALLIAMVMRVVTTRHRVSATSGLFAAGALCWLVSDFTYLLFSSSGALTHWMDTGWLLGALLLASSTWQRSDLAYADAGLERPMGRGSLALGLLPLLAPVVIELVGLRNGTDPDPVPLISATALLVVLAFVRGVRLLDSEVRLRERLGSQERYATAVAANSSDAVLVLDHDGQILNDAPQFAALVGSPELATRGRTPTGFFSPVDHPETVAAFARAVIAPGQVFEDEFEVIRNDDRRMWIATRMVNLLDDPDVGGVVVNIHDTTHRKEAERELAHQTFHDALTGLPNRALFSDRVEQALRRDRRSRLDPAVIYFDLDSFKGVNDSLGHEAGDRLLCEVSRRLLNAVRTGDAVTRLGADEFAVLIEQSGRPLDEAEEVARRVLQALEVPVDIDSQLITVSASVGIAVADAESTASSLLRDADVAMYRAKATGKGRSVVYEPAMRAAAMERLRLETDLVHALVANQFRLEYQPVVSLTTGFVTGFEALLRWDHPDLGVVPPDTFIPIAEDTGLIVQIGRWVLGEACRQAAEWRQELPGSGAISMAVNVSGSQIASANLVQHVAQSLEGSGLAPEALVLELTESVLVHDPDLAAKRLHELRHLGVRLAVDDFGTGYSSLSYLRQFPFDILKVDKSFVATITDADAIPAIVRGLLELGRTLGLETVAEGVEDTVQRDALRAQGCDLAQGYLFARPMRPVAARGMLARQRSKHAPADSPV